MVRAAIEGNPAFAVSEIELRQPGTSYTIDTLDRLRREFAGVDLHFIMGVDAANELDAWRDPARILAEYRPIVMSRAGWPDPDWQRLERIHPDARSLILLVDVPQLEIDSHTLRKRIAAGHSVRYLIPEGARRIIERESLYRPPELA
jgi:nicotinate-nucleotide adenylyltransferase